MSERSGSHVACESSLTGTPPSLLPPASLGQLVGGTAVMRRLFSHLRRVADQELTVLIEGETGTGKGLIAEEIHRHSPRCSEPFVIVDCGALAPSLMESELFGHAQGAFTGAHQARPGAFEAAHGGTVFLDEIGELPLSLQPRLLRVLDKRVVKRVSENHYRQVDTRVIAATNHGVGVAGWRF